MPFIEVQMLPGRTQQQRADFAAAVTADAVTILGTSPDRVRIRFIDIPDGYLARGGQLVGDSEMEPTP